MVDTPKVRQASQSWPLPDHGREQYLYGLHTIIFYTFCFAGIITFSARDDAHPLQTQPPSCTLAHAQMDSGFPCTASTHNCTLLPRVSVRLSGTDTRLDIVATTTCADNRNRCFSEPLLSFICHFPALVRRPQTPTGTHQPFLYALQRSRGEEEVEADEMAKKSRPHDEGEAWAPAEAAHGHLHQTLTLAQPVVSLCIPPHERSTSCSLPPSRFACIGFSGAQRTLTIPSNPYHKSPVFTLACVLCVLPILGMLCRSTHHRVCITEPQRKHRGPPQRSAVQTSSKGCEGTGDWPHSEGDGGKRETAVPSMGSEQWLTLREKGQEQEVPRARLISLVACLWRGGLEWDGRCVHTAPLSRSARGVWECFSSHCMLHEYIIERGSDAWLAVWDLLKSRLGANAVPSMWHSLHSKYVARLYLIRVLLTDVIPGLRTAMHLKPSV